MPQLTAGGSPWATGSTSWMASGRGPAGSSGWGPSCTSCRIPHTPRVLRSRPPCRRWSTSARTRSRTPCCTAARRRWSTWSRSWSHKRCCTPARSWCCRMEDGTQQLNKFCRTNLHLDIYIKEMFTF